MTCATTNNELIREYLNIVERLDGDMPGRRAAQSYLQNSTAIVHGTHVPQSYVPRFFDRATFDEFKRVAELTHSIACKIMQRYLDNPSFRELFDFDERLVDLILLPRDYDSLLPFARIDVFLDEETLACGFCELNSDGSSGMNEDREQFNSFAASAAFENFSKAHRLQSSELFDTWVAEFIAIYDTYRFKVDHPTFAIVDYLGLGAITAEFEEYCRRFALHGYPCIIADVRDLAFDGECLRAGDGTRIDAIWRRCVTSDVLDHWDESQALIDAVRARKVALIGSFAGHIPHDKQIFTCMHHPEAQSMLTAEELQLVEQSVPQTLLLDSEHIDLEEVRRRKDAWIIKPPDRYGATDVYAGTMLAQEQWDSVIERFANGKSGAPFLVQTYLTPYETPFLRPDPQLLSKDDKEVERTAVPMRNMSGLYLFNGRFAGVFSRMGERAVISEGAGSRYSAATVWVDCDL